jgi:hypothetical protein
MTLALVEVFTLHQPRPTGRKLAQAVMVDPEAESALVRAASYNEPRYAPVLADVLEGMRQRTATGEAKYGTPLHTRNGRSFLIDAIQEAADLVKYLVGDAIEQGLDPMDDIDVVDACHLLLRLCATYNRRMETKP